MKISQKETVLNQNILEIIQKYLPSIKSCHPNHFFIITDMNKITLTNNTIKNNYSTVILHITNIEDIDQLCILILEEISNQNENLKILD